MKLLLTFILFGLVNVFNAIATPLPSHIMAPVLKKLVSLEQTLAEQPSVTMYVMAPSNRFESLQTALSQYSDVTPRFVLTQGDFLPANNPDIIYVSHTHQTQLDVIADYSLQHNIPLIGDERDNINQGFTLVLAEQEGVLDIIINVNQSKTLGLKWSPELLNVVTLHE